MAVHVRFQDTLPLRVPEWIMAGMMTAWGLSLLANPDAFAQNPAFAAMGHILSQPTWGLTALLLGIAGLVGLAINGLWRATPFIRAISAFGRAFVWLQIEFGLLAGGASTTGTKIYIGLVFLELWNIYRAARDARDAVA